MCNAWVPTLTPSLHMWINDVKKIRISQHTFYYFLYYWSMYAMMDGSEISVCTQTFSLSILFVQKIKTHIGVGCGVYRSNTPAFLL
jgi:hypothetical protein